MSCVECETNKGVAYFRIGTANVGIIACHDHAKIVIEQLRKMNEEKCIHCDEKFEREEKYVVCDSCVESIE